MAEYKRSEGQCPHSDLDITLNHINFEDSNLHYLEVQAKCKTCAKPMVFRGNQFGVMPAHPTVAIDGSEAILPFLAEGEEPVGKIIGFSAQAGGRLTIVTSGIIEPQTLVDAFGPYQMGIAQSLKGDGTADDGRLMDLQTEWQRDPVQFMREKYLRDLVRRAKFGRFNFMEFHGWPEIRHRDDGSVMVYSRVRMMHVQVTFAPRI